MHAPKYPFAVRLIVFAAAESAWIETVLAQAPHSGPSYFCLHDDSLQEPDLFIADGDSADALACLGRERPGAPQPAVVVGGSAQAGMPCLARPVSAFQLYEALDELLAERRHPRLGMELADPAVHESRRQPPPEGTVLIIDKGGVFRDHVARVVDTRRLAIEWTDSARAAIRLCEETPVSLVMINTPMPGIDPYALSRSIKEQAGAERTAVVFLVSQAFRYDSVRAREAGVRGLLDKPVADRHLVAALRKLLPLPV